MLFLALLAVMTPEVTYDPNAPVLFRVPDFAFGAEFESHAYNAGYPVKRKVSRDGSCAVTYGPDVSDLHLHIVAGEGTPKREAVNMLAFMLDGRNLVVYRLGFAYPRPAKPSKVEHEVVTTARGKMLVAAYDSGFLDNEGVLKLEITRDGRLVYAYAKQKIAGAHLVPFFMRDTQEAECRLE